MITVALPKGALFEESLRFFKNKGLTFLESDLSSRRLFFFDESQRFKFLIVRPWDIPSYIESGAADLGIAGLDVLIEQDSKVIRLMNLKFGYCRLAIASPDSSMKLQNGISLATKYVHSASRYFLAKDIKVALIKLHGAIELAPLTGLSDMVCDLVATGKTMKAHGLSIIETIFESTAYLISNNASFRVYYDAICRIVEEECL